MLKQGTFINRKFNKLFFGAFWGTLSYTVNMMTDSLISGNQLGEVSLQAVSIVFPLFSVVSFFSMLISPGASVIFGKLIGEFREKEAHRAAGTAMVSAIIIGILLALGLWFIKEPFLRYYGCTGELYRDASAYYNWVVLFTAIKPFIEYLYFFTAADGDTLLFSLANIVDITLNIVLSIVLSRAFGISGLGMATCIAAFVKVPCYAAHFLRKTSNVKIHFCIDIMTVCRSVVLSFSNYMYYLFIAIVDIVLNKIIILNCGVELLPAYSVINLVFCVCEMFEAVNVSGFGFITCFLGEKNNHDMNFLLCKITRTTLSISFCICAVFFFAAPFMPIIYGLETPTTVKAAVFASRVMAFTSLGFGACYLIDVFSSNIEKPAQACFMTFLYNVFSPLLLSVLFGSVWDFRGIAVGMSFSPYLAFAIYAFVQIPRKGKADFPLYVEDFGEEGISFDLYVTKDSIIEVREWLHGNLEARGFDTEKTNLLIEEFYTRVMEKNPGRKVLSECTLLFKGDVVRIIIRDDGTLFNFVDENNPVESLNAHVLNSLLEQTKEKNYVLTTSFNRNGFVFEKSN